MTTATSPVRDSTSASMPDMSRRVPLMIMAGLVLAACLPLVCAHFYQLWHRPHYQFFPFVLLGAGVLGVLRFRQVWSLQSGSPRVSWGLVAVAWSLLACAELLHSSWLGAVAALFVVVALIHGVGGAALIKKLLPAWLFLWLIIPPLPGAFGVDTAIVLGLQDLTSYWSSAVLDQFGVVHVFAGNVVEVGGRTLFVEEACAGVNSLFSILACTLFYILFARVPIIRAVFLVLAAVSWVLLANVARVVLVAYLLKTRGLDLTEGWRHDAIGYVLFAVALVMIGSSDRLLMFFASSRYRAIPANEPAAAATSSRRAPWSEALTSLRSSWLGSWVAGGLFGALLAAHVAVYGLPLPTAGSSGAPSLDPARLDVGTLPEKLDGWRREKFATSTRNPGSAFGEFSSTWNYQGESVSAAFSVDYPFGSWHDAHVCYRNQGWDVESLTEHASTGSDFPEFHREVKLKKAGMRSGYLFYCEFDHTGRAVESERRGVNAMLERGEQAFQRWTNWPAAPAQRQVGTLFQFQLFLESQSPLSDEEIAASQQRFLSSYRLVHERLMQAPKQ